MNQQKQGTKVTHQRFGVFNMDHTHALDLFGGEETELDFLDGAQRRLGIREKHVRHDVEIVVTKSEDEKKAEMTGQESVS